MERIHGAVDVGTLRTFPNAGGAFVATATGLPTPTVQWQVSTDRRRPWVDVPGATDTTLSFTAPQTSGDTSRLAMGREHPALAPAVAVIEDADDEAVPDFRDEPL